MNYRENSFSEKFKNAALNLNAKPDEIISLKIRETVNSYSEYHRLLDTLEHDFNITYKKLTSNFQGNGYLLTDSISKVIIVEHETGLEILYIAGSIASLISIIPLIIKGWKFLRGQNNFRNHPHDYRNIEIRRLDSHGHLNEENIHNSIIFDDSILPNSLLISAVQKIEAEILKLTEEINSLNSRVKAIEKNNTKENSKRNIQKKTIKQKKK